MGRGTLRGPGWLLQPHRPHRVQEWDGAMYGMNDACSAHGSRYDFSKRTTLVPFMARTRATYSPGGSACAPTWMPCEVNW